MATDTLEAAGIAIGIAAYLEEDRLGDARYLAEQEARLMQGIEDCRRFEQWRRGMPLRAQCRGFTRERERQGLRLELRARLFEERPDDGMNVREPGTGTLRRWPGPGCERWLADSLDQLPLATS